MDRKITVVSDLEDCLNDLHDCTIEQEFINHDDDDVLYEGGLTLINAAGKTMAKGHDAIAMYIGSYVLREACGNNINMGYQKLRNGEYE